MEIRSAHFAMFSTFLLPLSFYSFHDVVSFWFSTAGCFGKTWLLRSFFCDGKSWKVFHVWHASAQWKFYLLQMSRNRHDIKFSNVFSAIVYHNIFSKSSLIYERNLLEKIWKFQVVFVKTCNFNFIAFDLSPYIDDLNLFPQAWIRNHCLVKFQHSTKA